MTVKKWGNSAAVRIPSSVMRVTRLDLDDVVEVREESGRIVIEPVREKTYDLGKLLKAITSKNQGAASAEELAEVRAKIIALIG